MKLERVSITTVVTPATPAVYYRLLPRLGRNDRIELPRAIGLILRVASSRARPARPRSPGQIPAGPRHLELPVRFD
jgi:hypothetical protein